MLNPLIRARQYSFTTMNLLSTVMSYISVMFVRRAGTKVNAGAREQCKGLSQR